MKPMRTTEVDITLGEFKKQHRIEHPLRYLLASVVLLAPPLYFIPFYFVDFRWISMLIATAIFAAVIGAYLLIHRNMMKRLYSAADKRCSVRFYDDRIEQEGESGVVSAEYSVLEKVTETRKNIYLRISKNHTVVLIKKNCSEELLGFLKLKLRKAERRVEGLGTGLVRNTAPILSVMLAVVVMGIGVCRGNIYSDIFSYKYHCPICYRVEIGTLKAQQQWVYDYLDWEYSTVNSFVCEYILPVFDGHSEV